MAISFLRDRPWTHGTATTHDSPSGKNSIAHANPCHSGRPLSLCV